METRLVQPRSCFCSANSLKHFSRVKQILDFEMPSDLKVKLASACVSEVIKKLESESVSCPGEAPGEGSSQDGRSSRFGILLSCNKQRKSASNIDRPIDTNISSVTAVGQEELCGDGFLLDGKKEGDTREDQSAAVRENSSKSLLPFACESEKLSAEHQTADRPSRHVCTRQLRYGKCQPDKCRREHDLINNQDLILKNLRWHVSMTRIDKTIMLWNCAKTQDLLHEMDLKTFVLANIPRPSNCGKQEIVPFCSLLCHAINPRSMDMDGVGAAVADAVYRSCKTTDMMLHEKFVHTLLQALIHCRNFIQLEDYLKEISSGNLLNYFSVDLLGEFMEQPVLSGIVSALARMSEEFLVSMRGRSKRHMTIFLRLLEQYVEPSLHIQKLKHILRREILHYPSDVLASPSTSDILEPVPPKTMPLLEATPAQEPTDQLWSASQVLKNLAASVRLKALISLKNKRQRNETEPAPAPVTKRLKLDLSQTVPELIILSGPDCSTEQSVVSKKEEEVALSVQSNIEGKAYTGSGADGDITVIHESSTLEIVPEEAEGRPKKSVTMSNKTYLNIEPSFEERAQRSASAPAVVDISSDNPIIISSVLFNNSQPDPHRPVVRNMPIFVKGCDGLLPSVGGGTKSTSSTLMHAHINPGPQSVSQSHCNRSPTGLTAKPHPQPVQTRVCDSTWPHAEKPSTSAPGEQTYSQKKSVPVHSELRPQYIEAVAEPRPQPAQTGERDSSRPRGEKLSPSASGEQEYSQNEAVPKKPCIPTPYERNLSRVNEINAELQLYVKQIEVFKGQRSDKEFLYLDEMLTRLLIRLDAVTGDEIRAARRETIKRIQKHFALLELNIDPSPVVKRNRQIMDVL